MSEISAFRGASGEVVRAFVSPATLLTVVPTAVASVLCSVLAGLLAGALDLPGAVALPLMVLAGSPVIGLFAMSARAGRLGSGFFECLTESGGAAVGFTIRHGILAIAWAAPLALVAQGLAGRASGAMMGGPAALASGGMILGLAALLVLATIAPALALLVATRADSVGEAFSPDTWAWVVGPRRGDLPAFFASAIGGLVLFAIVAWPIGGLFVAMVATTSPELAAVLGVAVYATPAAASPILVGRLAGAFAAGDYLELPGTERQRPVPGSASPAAGGPSSLAGTSASAPARPARPVPASVSVATSAAAGTSAAAAKGPGTPGGAGVAARPAPAPGEAVAGPAQSIGGPSQSSGAAARAPVASRPDARPPGRSVARAMADIEAALGNDADRACALAGELVEAEPRNSAAAALLARVQKAAGREDAAREAAGRAIRLALEGGAAPVALEVFRSFAREAHRLGLDGGSFTRLGRVLVNASELSAATWCFRAAARLEAPELPVQKGLVAVIEAARAAGDDEAARRTCDAFLADHPNAAFAEHVRLWRQELEPAGASA